MITVLVSDENNDKDIVTAMMMRILTITVMQIYHIYDTFSVSGYVTITICCQANPPVLPGCLVLPLGVANSQASPTKACMPCSLF